MTVATATNDAAACVAVTHNGIVHAAAIQRFTHICCSHNKHCMHCSCCCCIWPCLKHFVRRLSATCTSTCVESKCLLHWPTWRPCCQHGRLTSTCIWCCLLLSLYAVMVHVDELGQCLEFEWLSGRVDRMADFDASLRSNHRNSCTAHIVICMAMPNCASELHSSA